MKDAEKDIQNMLNAEPEENYGYEVELIDDDGNSHYFYEEQQFQAGKNIFAILVPFSEDDCDCDDEECHCHDHDHEDEDRAVIAKVIFNEEGDPEYVSPTDEEFEMAKKAYAELED